jgi:UDP-N-acetylmuramate dehydrogenase
LVKFTVDKNLWGLENLSYIPGSVGAAPVQNIGAYGAELQTTFVSCKVFDVIKNKFLILNKKDCKFGNRDSIFKHKKNRYIIWSVKFRLSKIRKPILSYRPLDILDKKTVSIKEIRDLIIKTRAEKLPDYQIWPNSGSFFKNPIVNARKLKELQKKFPQMVYFVENKKYKIPIAWFIENVIKMKGVVIGNFSTYKNHSLVVVNHNGLGEAKELNKFIKLIEKKIEKKTGLKLEQEVNFIG